MLGVNRLVGAKRGTYRDLAAEYYDPSRHPTCANFREASFRLIRPWLLQFAHPEARILETGAGDSIVSGVLKEEKRTVAGFVATDISPEMLSYSRASGVSSELVVCDAQALPMAPDSFDVVVSSLGDPYNTTHFWREIGRVLRTGGHALFSTPSFEWAARYRGGEDFAEFLRSDGEIITVPSYVRSDDVQRSVMEERGFVVIDFRTIEDTGLHDTPRSPKLRRGHIVSGYLVRKAASDSDRI